MNGYILESRSILNSAIWKMPPLYFKVWHFLLLKAQYTDYKGLKRGQLYTSIGEIREACSYYVGFRKETPTRKEIWSILEWLRGPHEEDAEGNTKGNNERNMIVTTKATHGLLVTICNFNVYQDPKNYEGNNERNTNGTMNGTRTEFEGNNINEEGIKKKNKKKKRERGSSPSPKKARGRNGKVMLTDQEYKDIKDTFENHIKLINHVGDYLANANKEYKDHSSLIWRIGNQDGWTKRKREQTESTRELSAAEKAEIRRQEAEALGL